MDVDVNYGCARVIMWVSVGDESRWMDECMGVWAFRCDYVSMWDRKMKTTVISKQITKVSTNHTLYSIWIQVNSGTCKISMHSS